MFTYEIHNSSNHDVVITAKPNDGCEHCTGFVFKGHYSTWDAKWKLDVLFNASGNFDAEDCARAVLEEEIRIAVPDYRFDLARDIKKQLA
jgi:hypothetical protein